MFKLQNYKTTLAGIAGIVIGIFIIINSGDTVQATAIILTSLGLIASKDA